MRAAVIPPLSAITLCFFTSDLAAQACRLFVFVLLSPVLLLTPHASPLTVFSFDAPNSTGKISGELARVDHEPRPRESFP